MKKHLAQFAAASLFATLIAGPVTAQSYPTKPIKLVVPYPPGGSADALARGVGVLLSKGLGQQVIVENKAGAGTAIGTREVAAAPADGYTLLLGTVTSHAMNPALNPKIGYDPIKDFVAVSPLATIPFALIARPGLPAKNFSELLVLSREKPGALTYASAGVGTSNHLAGELLQSMTGVKLNHVPYKGSAPALNDLLGGHVDVMFDLLLTATKHVRTNDVRALGITSRKRSVQLPDVPTFAELGLPGYDVSAWFGIFAPAGVPANVVERINASVRRAIESSDMQLQMAAAGAEPMFGSPAEFTAMIDADFRKWTMIIRERNIQSTP